MILNGTQTLQAVMGSAHATTAPSFWASWSQLNETDLITGDGAGGVLNGTSDVALVTGVSGNQMKIDSVDIFNPDTAIHTITFKVDVSGTDRTVYRCVLSPGDSAHYANGRWYVTCAAGAEILQSTEKVATGRNFEFLYIGTASEAVGVRYGFAKDSGSPGAWVPGSPGVNGWWTNSSDDDNAANPAGARQTGSPVLQNATYAWYLSRVGLATSVAHAVQLLDLLWYNTGIVVTLPTIQSISQPASSIPARDTYGTTNGHGWMAGLYVTTATTNVAAVTNTTLTYTNSDGTDSRTATMASFPATAVVGTFVPFQLQAGDKGIRSIQSITLGTSYVLGAVSLVMYRQLAFIPNTVANIGSDSTKRNTRVYDGTTFWWTYLSAATTATAFQAGIDIEDR